MKELQFYKIHASQFCGKIVSVDGIKEALSVLMVCAPAVTADGHFRIKYFCVLFISSYKNLHKNKLGKMF